MSRTKEILLFAMVASFSSTTMPAHGATNPFQKHSTAQTAAFMVCRDPNSTVTVQVIKRPIEALDSEWVKAAVHGVENLRGATDNLLVKAALSSINEEKLVHYQVIVRDASGNIIPSENYGWSAPDGGGVGGFVLSSGTIYSDSDLSRYDANPVAELTTTWGNHYEARKEWEDRAVSMANYSILPFLQGVHVSSDEELKMTVLRYVEHCQNSAKEAFELESKRPGATVTKQFQFPGEQQGTVNIDGVKQNVISPNHIRQTSEGIINLSQIVDPPSENDPDMRRDGDSSLIDSDVLRSLADLLETGEDIVEVRQDMREERAERKAKERAERERLAAEEAERRRQEQLAEQRKKDSQKRTSEKKSDKKSDMKKDEPKKEMPQKTEPNPAEQMDSLDFSTMESCLDQQISIVRGILSSGEKATDAQVSKLNSLVEKYKSEKSNLQNKINGISDSAKRSSAQSKFNAIENKKKSVLVPLRQQAAQQHLFQNGSL